ncbi:MAG: T9SS type A sorting domain-containing protein [Panacibacter sp.]
MKISVVTTPPLPATLLQLLYNIIIAIVILCGCLITNKASSQNRATFDAVLLSEPPGHDCNGVIRFTFHTCECLNNYGIDITINGDGSWCGVGNTCSYNHCDGTGTVDKGFAPGTYEIVGTVNSGAGCSNPGEVFRKTVTVPNPPCEPGFLTYDVVQSPGYQCLGKIEHIFYTPLNCIAYNYIDIYLVDANGNEYWIDHPNIYGSSISAAPGTYKLKVKESNGCTVEQGGIVINPPPCPKLSLKYDPIEKVGFNCIAQLKNYTVTTDKPPCLTLNYYDMLIYDENKNLIFGPEHPDHPINVNLASGHKYYLESKLFFGQCTSGMQVLKIGPNECKGNVKATKIIPESNPGCKDGSIELKYNSDDCFSTWYANATGPNISKPSNTAIKGDKVTISGLAGNNYEIRPFETPNILACGILNVTVPTLNSDCDLQLTATATNKCPAKMIVKINAGASAISNPCIKEFQVRIYSLSSGLQTYSVPKQAEVKLALSNLPDDIYTIGLYTINTESEEITGCEKIVYLTINNCNSISKVAIPLAAKKTNQQAALNAILWPNPANQQLNIQLQKDYFAKGNITAALIDGRGNIVKQVIQQNSYKPSFIKLNTADIASGLYFLIIKDSRGKQVMEKVVVQH